MSLVCLGRKTIQVYSCQIAGKNKTLFAEDDLIEHGPSVVFLVATHRRASCPD